MIYVVEVLAIYENPGVTPNAARINQRNTDFAQAQTAEQQVQHYTVPGLQTPEYLLSFGRSGDTEPTSRYGFGWRCREYISVRQDADNVGRAIWTQLSSRGLRDGTKVEVFEHLADEGNPFATGALLFARYLPAGSGRDVG
jgi:hypothetical protein